MARENKSRHVRSRNGGVWCVLLLVALGLIFPFGGRAYESCHGYNAGTATAGRLGERGPLVAQAKSRSPMERARGVIIHVSDGDTADFRLEDGTEMRLRFYGIDSPESSQEFGAECRRFTTQCLLKKQVEILVHYDDQYGRKVATIYLNGKDFCLEMVARGYAWHWARYYDSQEYARAMKHAQDTKAGLWGEAAAAGREAVPPWEFRKAHPRRLKKNQN